MKPKASFYFVLYLIGIVNLLAIITERDYAIDNLRKDYRSPLKLTVPASSEFLIGRSDTVQLLVANLKSDEEKRSIRYHVVPLSELDITSSYSEAPDVNRSTGDGMFIASFSKRGEYRFKVWAEVTRQLPKDAGGHRLQTFSDTTVFMIAASNNRSEIPGGKFAMEVDKKFEQWISGVPYTKTIFVNTDPEKVHLSGLPPGFRRVAHGANSIQLVWDKPMPGTIDVSLHGNAGRKLEQALDAASLLFAVNVEPPVWNPLPQKAAYWNIPYTFQSKVGELDVNDYVIKAFANGSTLIKQSGGQAPMVIVPERKWNTLAFVAVSTGGHELLRTEIPVKTPPPPQIKWTSSRLEGDDYVISFTAEDVGGKDVNVNCALVQPTGLNAVLNARHGKAFTFTIKNVTQTRPTALVVRTSIHGIGGASTPLDRTFPILY